MTIKEAIKKGLLPKVEKSEIKDFIEACQKVIKKVNSLDDTLTNSELNKLRYSGTINKYYISKEIKKTHSNLLKDYDDIIGKYNGLLNSMKNNAKLFKGEEKEYFTAERKEIELLAKELQNQRNEHYKNIVNFDKRYANLLINEDKLKEVREEINQIEKEIDNNNKDILRYQNDDKKYKTNFMKSQNKKKIIETQKRIEMLQQKKALIQTKQKQIINKNAEKYTKIQNKKIKKVTKELDRYQIHAEAEMKSMENIQKYRNDISLTEKEINNLERQSGLRNKFKLMAAKADKRKLGRKLNTLEFKKSILDKLKYKKGTCIFSEQLYKNITNKLASENTFQR